MDYRNADGTIAEMCGNGVRVFARYLLDAGPGGRAGAGDRHQGGPRPVRAEPDGQLTVDMGGAQVTRLRARYGPAARSSDGLAISVGNPHLACMIDTPVADFELTAPQMLAPEVLAGRGER